jgi:glycosyltransferase involved in cell wall biosynthesis
MATICWRVPAGDADIASIRYRCLIPMRHLKVLGIDSAISWGAVDPLRSRPRALVLVKALAEADVGHAARAAARGVRVLVDVCDNVFADGYRTDAGANLRAMAEHAAGIVTTGSALAEALGRHLGSGAPPIHVVPDPLETPEEAVGAAAVLWHSRVRAIPHGSPRDAATTAGYGARRALRRLRRRTPGPQSPRSGLPRVMWFGNAGSIRPRYGLVNLVDVADELREAAAITPYRLLVVTGDRAAYDDLIAPLHLPSTFAPWEPQSVFRHLRESHVAVLPNSRDEFSIGKSANRAVTALSQAVPVVATRVPALEPLHGCVVFDDFAGGVVRYLRDRDLVATHVARAQPVIEREFAASAVAKRWAALLGRVS